MCIKITCFFTLRSSPLMLPFASRVVISSQSRSAPTGVRLKGTSPSVSANDRPQKRQRKRELWMERDSYGRKGENTAKETVPSGKKAQWRNIISCEETFQGCQNTRTEGPAGLGSALRSRCQARGKTTVQARKEKFAV